jgi:AraC-like DNA-binding protein
VRGCDRSDERGASLCQRAGGPVAYRCHTGLTEVIAPVRVAGRLVACVNCGQVLMRAPTRGDFARLWRRIRNAGLSRDELEGAYLRIPVASEKRIRTVARILAMTAEHLSMRPAAATGAPSQLSGPGGSTESLQYCARLVTMIESGAGDEAVVRGMDRLAARLAGATRPGRRSRAGAVSAAVEYFVEHYADSPSLREAARRTGLSPYYLGKLFRRTLGMSPAAFLRGLRMLRARDLLAEEEFSVTQVAERVGYADPAYFCRHFRAQFGLPPSRVAPSTIGRAP